MGPSAKNAVKYAGVVFFGIIFALFLQKAIEIEGVGDFWNITLIPLILYGVAIYLLAWRAYSRLLAGLFELDTAYASTLDFFSYIPTVLLAQYFFMYRLVTAPFEQKLLVLVFLSICSIKVVQFFFLLSKRRRLQIKAFFRPMTLGLLALLPVTTFLFIRSYDYLLYKTIEPRLIVKPLKEVSINNELRQVLYSPAPYLPQSNRIEKQVTLPQNALMQFGIGIAKTSWFQSDTVYMEADGRKERIYSRMLDPKNNVNDRGWVDETLDLAPYSGKSVTIIFETKVPYSEISSLKKLLKSSFGYTKWLNIGKYGNILEAVWSEPKVFSKDHEQGPNLVLISFDTLGARHLGCYGYNVQTSPHLDQFASEGVKFMQCVVQAPWTLPSHASLFTGENCSTHGVITNDYRLNDSFTTLAEVFRNNGYQTAAITEGGNISADFGLNQGFEMYDNGSGHGIDKTFGKAINWLDNKRTGKFFLFLHTYETHAYYEKREPYYSQYSHHYRGMIKGNELFLAKPKKEPYYLRPEDVQELTAIYDSEVSYIDSYFKKLMDKLEELDLKEKTTVVVTSDHGEGFGEHDYFGHGNTLHDELLLVPLIIRSPHLPRQLVVEKQVRSIDIMPTLIDLFHFGVPAGLDGESLLPLLRRRPMEVAPALSEVDEPGYGKLKKSLRTGTKKLIVTASPGEFEFYDLVRDPQEQNDIYPFQTKTAEQIRTELETILVSCSEKNERILGPGKTHEQPVKEKATLDQLKALGYLN
jgi:arylsulfatase A-like enzyme